MKIRVALLAICVVGLLVVFAILAVSAYASYLTGAASPAAVLDHPAPVNAAVTTDQSTLSSDAIDSGEPVDVPVHRIGSACDGDSHTSSADAGY
jgi:hypothetical protein